MSIVLRVWASPLCIHGPPKVDLSVQGIRINCVFEFYLLTQF